MSCMQEGISGSQFQFKVTNDDPCCSKKKIIFKGINKIYDGVNPTKIP